jgi:hypothetical protein
VDCRSTWSGKPHRPSLQSRIRCTRTPARPICRITPPAAKNKSAAGGAPAARGGGLARQRPAKNGWPSSCRARGHRLAGPPPPDSKAHCVNAPCPTRGPAGATPSPTLALAIAKKQAPGWEPGPGRQGAAKPDSLPGTPVRRAAFLPGRACPPLAICKPRRNQERKGANRAPLHPRGCWRTATKTPSPAPPALAPQTLHGGPAPRLRPKRSAQPRRGSGRGREAPGCQGSR